MRRRQRKSIPVEFKLAPRFAEFHRGLAAKAAFCDPIRPVVVNQRAPRAPIVRARASARLRRGTRRSLRLTAERWGSRRRERKALCRRGR